MQKLVHFSLEGLQLGLLEPALHKKLWGSMEEISAALAAVIMARMVNANRKPFGWILREKILFPPSVCRLVVAEGWAHVAVLERAGNWWLRVSN